MSANPRANIVSKQNAINNTVEYSYDKAKRPTSQSVSSDTIQELYLQLEEELENINKNIQTIREAKQ